MPTIVYNKQDKYLLTHGKKRPRETGDILFRGTEVESDNVRER